MPSTPVTWPSGTVASSLVRGSGARYNTGGRSGRNGGCSPVLARSDNPPNLARFIFLAGSDSGFYADRAGMSRACVGNLRAETGRNPADTILSGLISDLSAGSAEFRALWAEHDVEYYRTGVQPFRHPVAGDLTLNYNAFELPGDPGQTMIVYTADPDSPSHEALTRLAAPVSQA